MITLKTIKGKHIVTVDGNESIFDNSRDAWEFIYTAYVRRIKASL